MPTIDVVTQGFPNAFTWGNTRKPLTVSWGDIVWAAISVGKKDWADLHAHGIFSSDEMTFREFMVYANLQQQGTRVHKSPVYGDLSPSEKGAVSYFLGMAFAKLAAAVMMKTPWLVHLEKLQKTLVIPISGQSRPDLLGRTTAGDWIVVEAKGRTGSYSGKVMAEAKKQAGQIRTVNGHPVSMRVASQAFFSRGADLEIRLRDPEEDEFGYDVQVSEEEFFAAYYEPFARIPEQSGQQNMIGGESYFVVDHDTLGVSIGVPQRVMDREFVPSPTQTVEPLLGGRRASPFSMQPYQDGLAITLSDNWSEHVMRLAPDQRHT